MSFAYLVVALHRLELGEVELRPLGECRPFGADHGGRRVAQAVACGLERLGELVGGVAHCSLCRGGATNPYLVHRYACRPVNELLPCLVAEVLCHARPPCPESRLVGGRVGAVGRVPGCCSPSFAGRRARPARRRLYQRAKGAARGGSFLGLYRSRSVASHESGILVRLLRSMPVRWTIAQPSLIRDAMAFAVSLSPARASRSVSSPRLYWLVMTMGSMCS